MSWTVFEKLWPKKGLKVGPGAKALGVLRVASNVADTETVTIGNDVYEFDRAGNGVVAGRIPVTGHADDTPANATTALVSAINASGTEHVRAVRVSANEVLVFGRWPKAQTTALAETLAGANNAWDTAALRGGGVHAVGPVVVVRAPNATEVALATMEIPLDFVPRAALVQVRVTATGALKAWDGAIVLNGVTYPYVKLDNSVGTVHFDAADTVTVVIWG